MTKRQREDQFDSYTPYSRKRDLPTKDRPNLHTQPSTVLNYSDEEDFESGTQITSNSGDSAHGTYDNKQYDVGESKQHTAGPLNTDTGMRSAFPISVSKPNGDMSKPALSAAEYLARVRYESLQRPYVVSITTNPELNKPRATSLPPSVSLASSDVKSSVDSEIQKSKFVSSIWSNPVLRPAPSLKVDCTWYTHFLKVTFPKFRAQVKQGSTKLPTSPRSSYPKNMNEWRQHLIENNPTPPFIRAISYNNLMNLLQIYPNWISASSPIQLLTWLYALLASLSDLIESNIESQLRKIAIRCINVYEALEREKLQPDLGTTALDDGRIQREVTLKMVVAVVAGFYGQKDLVEMTGKASTKVNNEILDKNPIPSEAQLPTKTIDDTLK